MVTPTKPRTRDLPATATMVHRPNSASSVYSAGPKSRAKRASQGAMMIRQITPNTPPKNDDRVDRTIALPASPRRAMG